VFYRREPLGILVTRILHHRMLPKDTPSRIKTKDRSMPPLSCPEKLCPPCDKITSLRLIIGFILVAQFVVFTLD
jgi:hypothetical protein